MKTVSQLNAEGYFTGPVIADESPLEPGVYLIPGGAVDSLPPSTPAGSRAKWIGDWVFEPIPAPPPEPEPEPEPANPTVVTMRQARLALLANGLLAQVETAIEALPSPQKEAARIEWDYSSEVHRDKPFVQSLAAALSLTPAQLDALFVQAAAL